VGYYVRSGQTSGFVRFGEFLDGLRSVSSLRITLHSGVSGHADNTRRLALQIIFSLKNLEILTIREEPYSV
jgi:hypothetical protein